MPISLEGKVVIVTGASSGIGRAAAVVFAREGATVVLAARRASEGENVAKEIRASGGTALFVRTDVSRAEEVEALSRVLREGLRPGGKWKSQECLADREHIRAARLCGEQCRRVVDRQERPGGTIVNVSSVNGLGAAPGAAFYSMAKAGILALTKAAAMEYAAEGIRVNALVAGAFDTPMLNKAWEQAAGRDVERRKAMEQQFLSVLPLRRIGRPEEAAEAAVWLCSEGSSYMTGNSMIVDGGWTAWFR